MIFAQDKLLRSVRDILETQKRDAIVGRLAVILTDSAEDENERASAFSSCL